jgi:hypothetical protein
VDLTGEGGGEIAANPVDDRRSQQERAQPRRLAVEHLGDQVVGDDAVVARELLDEPLGVVTALQGQGGEPQSGGPALG